MQLLEGYRHCHNNAKLMRMPNLEDPKDKWEVEEVQDKRQIKGVIHYFVKWAS